MSRSARSASRTRSPPPRARGRPRSGGRRGAPGARPRMEPVSRVRDAAPLEFARGRRGREQEGDTMTTTSLFVTELESPQGAITFARRGERLVALCFKDHWPRLKRELEKRFGALELVPDAKGGRAGRAL